MLSKISKGGTLYESSYRNVAAHIDKLVEAGIARVVKDPHAREKLVELEKIIKIETRDVKKLDSGSSNGF